MIVRPMSVLASVAWLFLACGVTEEQPPPPTGQTTTPGSTVTPGSTSPTPATGGATSTTPADPASPSGTQPTPSDPAAPGDPAATPAPSANPPPTGTAVPGGSVGHIQPGCGDTGFQVNVGTQSSTCDTLWLTADDVIQVTLGDNVGTVPPMAGRAYAVRSQAQVHIYPGDGEALAVFIGQNNTQSAITGSFTIDPWTTGSSITGSYDIGFADGSRLKGTFRSDICALEEGDCY